MSAAKCKTRIDFAHAFGTWIVVYGCRAHPELAHSFSAAKQYAAQHRCVPREAPRA